MSKSCTTLSQIHVISVAEREHDLPAVQGNIDGIRTTFEKEAIKTEYSTDAMVGRPSEVIVETARAKKSDMIIVGGYGLSGVSKMIMGSTTERIIATTPCAVLVVGDTSLYQATAEN